MWKILRFDQLDSTNSYAKRNCSLIADQSIIVANTQTAGRGRLNRKWLSQAGGLYFSIVLKPTATAHVANLTQLMALSVCQVLHRLQIPAQLKWPNDVLVNRKKICGILSEAVAHQNGFEALVLGVGLNVSQENLSTLDQPATSLALLGVQDDATHILDVILTQFFAGYQTVLQNGFAAIRTEYLAYFPYIGQQVRIANGVTPLQGTIQTISPNGELILQTDVGQTIISIGDICL